MGMFKVERVIQEFLNEPVKVYNFEVEDWHSYYVGHNNILVHNDCISGGKPGSKSWEKAKNISVMVKEKA